MKPKKKDIVKIFFKNGVQIEGKVYSWGKKIILATDDKTGFVVVPDRREIVMFMVTRSYALDHQKPQQVAIQQKPKPGMAMYYDEPLLDRPEYEPPVVDDDPSFVPEQDQLSDNNDLRTKKLVELHKLKIEEEKKVFAQKIRQHHIGEVKEINYELPGLLKK